MLLRSAVISNRFDRKGVIPAHIPVTGLGKYFLPKSDLISESKATLFVSGPITIIQHTRKFYLV